MSSFGLGRLTKNLCFCCLALLLSVPHAADAAGPWRTARPIKAVVVGGSISMYFGGNFGQYLQFGCKNLEVLNRGKVGAGGSALAAILKEGVIGDSATFAGMKSGNGWILFQGGLNSVGAPESTAYFLAKLFKTAHDAGLQVMALTLTPWGDGNDPRFAEWRGLRLMRATEHVAAFVMGKLSPKLALGARGDAHPETWQPGELPKIGLDLLHSPLRDTDAELRAKSALIQSFPQSQYRRQVDKRAELVAEAQTVPRSFLQAKYRDFDHTHPNSAGHRLIAALACQQAPADWGCDCDAIRHAVWKGKVIPGK